MCSTDVVFSSRKSSLGKMNEPKRELPRTMSLTDVTTSSLIRDVVERDLTLPADRSKHRFFLNLPKHDLVLPSLTRFDPDFRKFLLSVLVDFPLLKELEESKCLNWCPVLRKFLPLLTIADGNCLMNGASLSMWAINDRRLTLRKSVYQVLVEDQTGTFKHRWQLEHSKCLEDHHGSPVNISEEEWLQDWKKTVELASTKKSADAQCYSGLEDIHIFALSNVLRRPIIVLCDDIFRGNYDESLAEVNLGGVYLPLLVDSVDCVKSPLVLGYHHGHFTALVTTEDGSIDVFGDEELQRDRIKNAVPLVKNDGSVLRIPFLLLEEKQHSDRLLREYLSCSKVEYVWNGGKESVLVAVMPSQEPEAHLDQMFKSYFDALQAVYLEKLAEKMYISSSRRGSDALFRWSNTANPPPASLPLQQQVSSYSGAESQPCCSAHKKCKTTGCKYYTTDPNGLCYRCKQDEKQVCTSPGCGFQANPENQGLCSVCFARYHAIVEQGSTVAPSAPPSTPPLNKCRTENCNEKAHPNLHNMCLQCYLTFIETMYGGPPERQALNQPSVAVAFSSGKPVGQELSSGSKMQSPAASAHGYTRQISLFCMNPNCHSRLPGSSGQYCSDCMKNIATVIPPESFSALQASPGSPQASMPISSSPKATFSICCVSGCTMPAVTYHGELCLAHYKQSRSQSMVRNFGGVHDVSAQSLREAQGTKCINTGCEFYGNPETNYLCSRCHAKALQEQYDVERIRQEERTEQEWFARNAQFSGYHYDGIASPRKAFYIQAPSQKSSSAPPSPKLRKKWPSVTIPCVTKGCPRFGMPETKGLCEICFKKLELVYDGLTGRSRFCSTP